MATAAGRASFSSPSARGAGWRGCRGPSAGRSRNDRPVRCVLDTDAHQLASPRTSPVRDASGGRVRGLCVADNAGPGGGGDRGAVRGDRGGRPAAAPSRRGQPAADGALSGRRYDAGATDGVHRHRRPRPPAAGLGRPCLDKDADLHPPPADRGPGSATDRRAMYVGVDAYAEAGGVVARDLFDEDHGGYFADPALLDRLVLAKLEGEAQACVRKAGRG